MKIAFLFLVISSISYESVWEKFFSGNLDRATIYIHSKEPFDPKSVFKHYEMPEKAPTSWEHTMRAQIAMLKAALEDPENTKFVFVSNDSLPIQQFDYIYQQLTKHQFSIFPYWRNHHQYQDSSFYYAPRIVADIPADKQYINPQWVVLNRKHAELMVRDQSIIEKVEVLTADNEHYPSTFLAMHDLLHTEVINQSVMFVEWHRGYKHPYTFTNLEDRYQAELLTEAIIKGVLFARKFADSKEFNVDAFNKLIELYGLHN